MAPIPGSQQPSPQQATNTVPAVPEPDWIGTGKPANTQTPVQSKPQTINQGPDPVNLAPDAYQKMYGTAPQNPSALSSSQPVTASQAPVPTNQPVEDEFTKSLKGTQEYKMQQALNKPIFDLYEQKKQQENKKLFDMQQFLDQQAKEDSFMVQNEIQSITSSRDENIQLLKAQKEAELSIAEEDRKYRISNIEKAKQDALDEADLAILDQSQKNIEAEKRARTALGLTGGFGSVAKIEQMESNLQQGNKIISNLRISKAKLSEKFAMDADQIQRDHTKGMLDVMFRYDTHLVSFRKEAEDDIRAVQKQALLTKQQKQEKYLQIKEKYYENIDAIEDETATLMTNINKQVYSDILKAQEQEFERKKEEEKNRWTRAMELLDTYGGKAGAPLAEKMLGLPEGSLPRSLTLDEAKTQLDYLKFEQEKAYDQARLALDREKFALDRDEFNFNQYKFDQEGSSGTDIYSSGGMVSRSGVVGSATPNTNWAKVPSNLKGNCVLFARSLVPDLPMVGVSSTSHQVNAQGKRKAINSKTPVPGSIAILPERGFYGHLAYVEKVNPDGTIYIIDANDPGGPGVLGKMQTLAAGGSGVGGVPGIRRKLVDPRKQGIEGYFVGKGALKAPSKFTRIDKSEAGNSKNSPDKTSSQKPNLLTDLSKVFGLPDLGALFGENQQKEIPDESSFDSEETQFEPQGSFADQVFNLTNDPEIYNKNSKIAKQLSTLPKQYQGQYLEGLKQEKAGKATQGKDFTQVNQLASRYKSLTSEIRELDQGMAFSKNFKVNTNNPYDDQALIFSFMKVLDPGSVVREGEFNTAAKNSSLLESISADWRKAVDGTGLLTSAQRKNIINTMKSLYNQKKSAYDRDLNSAKKVGQQFGIDPSLYLDYMPSNTAQMSGTSGGGGFFENLFNFGSKKSSGYTMPEYDSNLLNNI